MTENWEEKTRRKIQRENKRDLVAVPDHFVIVRKFDVKTQEKMSGMRGALQVDGQGLPLETHEGSFVDFQKLVLQAGIFEHNFKNVEGELEDFQDDVFLDLLMSYGEVATEILNYILEYNRPLVKESASPSETAQNGASTDADSSQEKRSQTEPTQEES